MKHLLFLLLVMLFNCSDDAPSHGNLQDTPVVMVSTSNSWYHHGSLEEMDVANGTLKEIRRQMIYYFEGDTLLNGLQFMKMYRKQFDSIFQQPMSGGMQAFHSTATGIKYVAAMRQDADVVYYISSNDNTEIVYADFDINIGEVLNYRWNTDNVIVTEMDSIAFGSYYLKKYKLSNDQYFYEGIGASYGLFNAWQVNANVGGFMSCFRRDSIKIGIDEGFYAPINFCPEF